LEELQRAIHLEQTKYTNSRYQGWNEIII
jgi:hypothetical protein